MDGFYVWRDSRSGAVSLADRARGAPLAVGSVVHLYPHAFINALVLVPILIWTMSLLYRGLPVVLETGPNRGMLMASCADRFSAGRAGQPAWHDGRAVGQRPADRGSEPDDAAYEDRVVTAFTLASVTFGH